MKYLRTQAFLTGLLLVAALIVSGVVAYYSNNSVRWTVRDGFAEVIEYGARELFEIDPYSNMGRRAFMLSERLKLQNIMEKREIERRESRVPHDGSSW